MYPPKQVSGYAPELGVLHVESKSFILGLVAKLGRKLLCRSQYLSLAETELVDAEIADGRRQNSEGAITDEHATVAGRYCICLGVDGSWFPADALLMASLPSLAGE